MTLLAAPATVSSAHSHDARRAALACMVALAVALGVGRFAFTPLLPLMLQSGAIDIRHGGLLASFNYAGYFIGAISCAALRVDHARMVRVGLAVTVVLTLVMGVTDQFWIWALVRLVGGAVSAWTFVFASQWGLRRLTELGAHGWSGVIYTGPGVGIVGTGLLVSAAGGLGATVGWIGFGLISAVLAALVWHVFGSAPRRSASSAPETGTRTGTGTTRATPAAGHHASEAAQHGKAAQHVQHSDRATSASRPLASQSTHQPQPRQATQHADNARHTHRADAFWLIVLYGVPGFGYIITATFLPVIARAALPGSAWPDLFWPMFGVALIVGALLGARLPLHWDNRTLLAGCYVLQAAGIASGIIWPTAAGFAIGSMLIGLPFTAITLFAMREARRLHGDHAAGLMGYATAAYGIGQIVGPLVAAPVAAHTGSFSPALWLAASALMLGAFGLVVVTRVSRRAAR
ncbi:YbfB/YjiJ family MFS transporter [Paraburkholderia sp. GAS42]|jgi:predicted MFS family arabinose efflux permease|uniref:YbfB/YjiJ family MFS transporter n=1 Tax=Paraburkholderia sp. GAS42 TaxID=3035135 RepID=UPI003D1D1FB6